MTLEYVFYVLFVWIGLPLGIIIYALCMSVLRLQLLTMNDDDFFYDTSNAQEDGGWCLTKVFCAWTRIAANGFAEKSGLDTISGCLSLSSSLQWYK